MAKKLLIACEELEVEKYLDKELQADKLDEFDNLYESIKQTEDDKQDQPEPSESDDTQDLSDSADVATESLRELRYEISVEDWSSVGHYASKTVEFLAGAGKYLAAIGIHYTPIMLSKVYKGVLFSITKLVSGLINSVVAIQKQRLRVTESFQKSKDDIESLRKAIGLIQEPSDISDLQCINRNVINSLKIGSSNDLNKNLSVLEDFLSTNIKSISSSIDSDIGYIKQLITYVTSNTVKAPNEMMSDIHITKYLTEKVIEGYNEQSDLIKSYGYEYELPGDVELIAQLPISGLDNIDSISKAYNQSSIFLGFNNSSFEEIDSISYMDKDALFRFLDTLDQVCTAGLEHVNFYTRVENHKRNLKYNFRLYISAIVNSSRKLSTADSLIDYVNLKAVFIDRVYLPAAIDIHDYTIKVVSNSLRFAKDNVVKLS